MTAQRLDGRALAEGLRHGQRERAQALAAALGRPLKLGMVLVGDHGPSAIYVRNKVRAAEAIGMQSRVIRLPLEVSQAALLAAVAALNADPSLDAFLVQLPLPPHLDEAAVVAAIAPQKDADGLHPHNVGALVAGRPGMRPCTPAGCVALLDSVDVPIAGAHAVVVGRSAIVGKPMALMLLARHATVTLCHAQTRDLPAHVGRADIVVAAVGRPHLIAGSWIKAGAAVIDVGINRVDGSLVGDVDYAAAVARAAYITPVPGGVGPMTVAMLLHNTLQAAEAALHTAPAR
jgi:methylenetetrahydrofolate dehydrogenase (NADP+)/methenyltetrahydrofolate cyclohydrolase